MRNKFQNKYRIPSARWQHWDYGWNGAYFITICTHKRKHYFGEIENAQITLSDIGQLAYDFWLEIPKHFPFITLDAFVVMPNHMHGILIIDKTDDDKVCTSQPTDIAQATQQESIGQKRRQNQGKNTISSIVGSYKSVVTKHARHINPQFAWQTRFHDHVIKNDQSFQNIQNYINNNIAAWKDDRFYK